MKKKQFFLITWYFLGMTITADSKFTPSLESVHAITLIPETAAPYNNSGIMFREYIKLIQKRSCSSLTYITHINEYAPVVIARPGIQLETITPETPITIFSRGYAKRENPPQEMPRIGGGVYSDFLYRLQGAIHTPSIVFDYPDNRKDFNLGQKIDYSCLSFIYNKTIEMKSPTSSIILFGDCRGAMVALQLAASPESGPITTLILASPLVSTKEMLNQIANNYLLIFGSYGAYVLDTFFSRYFPNYSPNDNLIEECIHSIQGKQIFIANRANDSLVSTETITRLAKVLAQKNEVYCCIIDDTSAPHSKLYLSSTFISVLNAFYRKYHLPHDPLLASAAAQSLESLRIKR